MKTILVADDQAALRELISVTLEEGSYRILMADNGDETLAIARAARPDMILLDVQMPGGRLDGLEVCRLLKQDARTKHIYIVILTAKGQTWDTEAGYAVGADDYLVKPFSPLELMDKVASVLR